MTPAPSPTRAKRNYREFICLKCNKIFAANFTRKGICWDCQRAARQAKTDQLRKEKRAAWREAHPKKSYYTLKNQRFALYDRRAKCPVCAGRYTDIDTSLDICERHAGWLITVCEVCGVTSFCEARRFCVDHGPADLPRYAGPAQPQCSF
jgi:hypothetical protein